MIVTEHIDGMEPFGSPVDGAIGAVVGGMFLDPRQDGDFTTGHAFKKAVCDHFGLRKVLDVDLKAETDEVFSATITVAVSAADLAAIAQRMGESA